VTSKAIKARILALLEQRRPEEDFWCRFEGGRRRQWEIYARDTETCRRHMEERTEPYTDRPKINVFADESVSVYFMEIGFDCKECDGRCAVPGIGDRIIECDACHPYYYYGSPSDKTPALAVDAFLLMLDSTKRRH
jgi:hypothetical protein